MGRMIRIREETYNKLTKYAAERGLTKAGAVTLLITNALEGEEKLAGAESMGRLEVIEKKLDKLILVEMGK